MANGDGLLLPHQTGLDDLRTKPIVQFREIEVPSLPIPPNWMSWQCTLASLAEDGFGMHPKEASSVS